MACKEKQINWILDAVFGGIIQILNSMCVSTYLFIPSEVVKALYAQ